MRGALLNHTTFWRVLGTRNASEPILSDLLTAWRSALTDKPLDACAVTSLEIRDRVQPRGDLTVDLRTRDTEERVVVALQHRAGPPLLHRAPLHSCASAVKDPAAGGARAPGRSPPYPYLQPPMHTLTFSDCSAATGALRREPGLALQLFALRPCSEAMARMGQREHPALSADLRTRLSFAVALMPHAPLLQELTPATLPLLQWVSVFAHAAPGSFGDVPKCVRSGGLALLLDLLEATADETRREQEDAVDRAQTSQ